MTERDAWKLRTGDAVLYAGVVPVMGPPTAVYVRAQVLVPWNGLGMVVRWGNGVIQQLVAAQLVHLLPTIDPLGTVPREVAAFAAGVFSARPGSWKVIAVAVEVAGMGKFEPLQLEEAVRDWTNQSTTRANGERGLQNRIDAALARLRKGQQPS